MNVNVRPSIERAYRAHWGELTAVLSRQFGASQLDLVEAVVQEAFVKAMERWPVEGVPEKPVAWLLAVARHLRVDHARRQQTAAVHQEEVERSLAAAQVVVDDAGGAARLATEISDDQLQMMFVCNHPDVTEDARIPLTLRTLCGFETEELARAYLTTDDAMKKRLVRARQQIRDAGLELDLPAPAELGRRVDSVLATLYLLFSEGYAPHGGEQSLRRELAGEAIRLATILVDHPLTCAPKVHALLALMHFQASRFDARADADGVPIVLKDQDRSLWDQRQIRAGFVHLAEAAKGEEPSRYHLEASIAACHARAADFASTDWPLIVQIYELMLAHFPSDTAAVGHAIAVGQLRGPEAGLKLLAELEREGRLAGYAPLHAAKAEFHAATGDLVKSTAALRLALEAASTEAERAYFRRRLSAST